MHRVRSLGIVALCVVAFPATPDSSIRFAGAETYAYRLTLTTAGFADYPMPLAVPRADPGEVEVVGWNVPDAAKRLPISATDAEDDSASDGAAGFGAAGLGAALGAAFDAAGACDGDAAGTRVSLASKVRDGVCVFKVNSSRET